MATLAIPFLLAFGISSILTPICRLVARRAGFVEQPKKDRWHRRPTALCGGVAIVLSTLAIGLTTHPRLELLELLGCGVAIAAFGLADDVLSLKASTKLVAQITVASALLFFGYRLGWTQSMLGDAMLTLFWIVGITNAFNLLDNMDGLCAGTALVAGTFLLIGLTNDSGVTPQALYLSALLGGTAGFFIYNVHPASIFMGDTGSLFLGLNIASITLLASPESSGTSRLVSTVVAPVLLLMIPIFDTTFVTIVRLLSGRKPSQGGRDHSSHRLVAIGLSEPRAVLTLWLLAAAGGTISLLMQRPDHGLVVLVALVFLLAMIIFGVCLAHIRIYQEGDVAKLQGETITPILANFVYRQRIGEILLDLCLIPLAYYMAYRLRFEGDRADVELSVLHPLSSRRDRDSAFVPLHRGRLSWHVAVLRSDGCRGVCQGCSGRHGCGADGDLVRVPICRLLTRRLRGRCRPLAAAAGRDAGVDQADGRVRAPSQHRGAALRRLRMRQRRQPGDDPRGVRDGCFPEDRWIRR